MGLFGGGGLIGGLVSSVGGKLGDIFSGKDKEEQQRDQINQQVAQANAQAAQQLANTSNTLEKQQKENKLIQYILVGVGVISAGLTAFMAFKK